MRRVIFNRKGGVGKSSITANLAAISAARGHDTLVVDLDAQGNASQYLLGDAWETAESDIAAFFNDALSIRIMPRDPLRYLAPTDYEGLHVLASSPELAELQSKLEARHKIYKLRELLLRLAEQFDRIYIDTPPAFNFYTLSALIAADSCLIPFDCDDFSRRALYTLLENVEETRADHNPELRIEGIVINQFLSRAKLPQRLVDELCEEGLPVLDTRLSSSVKMSESHDQCIPLIHFAPRHKLTGQFIALYEELEG
ncbi:MAG TPA: ParA family protein [Gammaproteobacteria bacterium]|nr:ParA family protein [Gammaproteobacteria bacterium]